MATGLPRFLPRLIIKGAKGREISAVQQALIANGYKIKADGVFGGGTQVALRCFQKHKGLFPSGVIDQATIDCLYAEPESHRSAALRLKTGQLSDVWPQAASAMGLAPVFWGRSYPPRALNVSLNGLDFIFLLEAGTGTGKSERVHFPGGDSGVTLGPGYDMRERKAADVERDLTVIGVDPAIAKTLSNGVKLHGELQVKPFVNAHKHDLTLSTAQQKQLLKIVMPKYEDIVKGLITIDLFQFEYDALVSIAYNPGGSLVLSAQHINSGEPEKAMKIIASRIHSGGKALPGLLSRRKKEVALYTQGVYC